MERRNLAQTLRHTWTPMRERPQATEAQPSSEERGIGAQSRMRSMGRAGTITLPRCNVATNVTAFAGGGGEATPRKALRSAESARYPGRGSRRCTASTISCAAFSSVSRPEFTTRW